MSCSNKKAGIWQKKFDLYFEQPGNIAERFKLTGIRKVKQRKYCGFLEVTF
jgi:hypothetical protein